MRIVQLQAENLKRLRAVDITPTEDLVVIAGRNAAGKTSVLDAIAWTLGGAALFKDSPSPVRAGQKHATATVDLGEVVVTRTWSAAGTTRLAVTGKDGARFSSPQQMLDGLVGSLSFDPLEFANTDAKAQRRALLGLVELPFDLDELDRRRAAIFEERTTANRDHKTLANAFSLLDEPKPLDGPVVSIDEAVAALNAANDIVRHNASVRGALAEAHREVQRISLEVEDAEKALERAVHRQAEAIEVCESRNELVAFLTEDPDIEALTAAVADADRRKDQARLAVEYAERGQQVADARAQADSLTQMLEAIDAEKDAGLRSAVMPTPGLSISDDGVLFNGVPLAQCSGAERLRVSLAIAMAANPDLRVIRITDGSLLDDDSLAIVAEMAAFADFQIWLEKVDSSGRIGIVIEDGAVVAVNEATS